MRRGQSLYIPTFTVTIIVVLIYALARFVAHGVIADVPTVGERAEAVLDGVHRLAATEQYLDLSAMRAADVEGSTVSDEPAETRFLDRFNQLMASHPLETIPSSFSIQTTAEGSLLMSRQDFVIALGKDVVRAPIVTTSGGSGPSGPVSVSSGGSFDLFPLSDFWFITEWFGKRDSSGSVNHPGIDIAAAEGQPVYAVADGTIERFTWYAGGEELYYLRHEMPTGWVCEYFHIQPLARFMNGKQAVTRGTRIAKIRDEALYGNHLDFRCYNPSLIPYDRAIAVFGEDSVADSRTQPADSTLAAHDSAKQRVYIDPYCLFNDAIQERILRSSIENQERLALEDRRPYVDPENPAAPPDDQEYSDAAIAAKIRYTCDAYLNTGVLTEKDLGSGSEAFLDAIIENTLVHEGGYVNDPDDDGGPTNYGVTLDTLRAYRGDQSLDADDVRALSRDEAVRIFKEEYFYGPGIDQYPAPILPLMLDMSIHHGRNTASKLLQEALIDLGYEVEVTVRADEQSVRAAEQALSERGVAVVLDAMVDRRKEYMEQIIQADPKKAKYRDGWFARAESFRGSGFLDGIDVRVQDSAPQSSLRKRLSTPLPDLSAVRAMTRSVQDLRGELSGCDAGDAACALSRIQAADPWLSDVSACEDYPARVLQTLQACQGGAPGCACALGHPADVEDLVRVRFTAEEVVFTYDDGEVSTVSVSPDWLGVGEDIPTDLQIRLYGGSSAQEAKVAQVWVWSSDRPDALVSGAGSFTVPIGREWLWVSLLRPGGGAAVLLGDGSSASCDVKLPVRYCGARGFFWADQESPERILTDPDSPFEFDTLAEGFFS